jgi:hypothetical protein
MSFRSRRRTLGVPQVAVAFAVLGDFSRWSK